MCNCTTAKLHNCKIHFTFAAATKKPNMYQRPFAIAELCNRTTTKPQYCIVALLHYCTFAQLQSCAGAQLYGYAIAQLCNHATALFCNRCIVRLCSCVFGWLCSYYIIHLK